MKVRFTEDYGFKRDEANAFYGGSKYNLPIEPVDAPSSASEVSEICESVWDGIRIYVEGDGSDLSKVGLSEALDQMTDDWIRDDSCCTQTVLDLVHALKKLVKFTPVKASPSVCTGCNSNPCVCEQLTALESKDAVKAEPATPEVDEVLKPNPDCELCGGTGKRFFAFGTKEGVQCRCLRAEPKQGEKVEKQLSPASLQMASGHCLRELEKHNQRLTALEEQYIRHSTRLIRLEQRDYLPLIKAIIDNSRCLQVHPNHLFEVKELAGKVISELYKIESKNTLAVGEGNVEDRNDN